MVHEMHGAGLVFHHSAAAAYLLPIILLVMSSDGVPNGFINLSFIFPHPSSGDAPLQ